MNQRVGRRLHVGGSIAIMLMPVLLAAPIFGPQPVEAVGSVTTTWGSESANLIAGDANATQGVFARGLSLAPSAPVVAWSPPSIAASVRRGTSYTEALWLDVSADASDVSLEVSQSLADVIESFEIPDQYNLTTGREYFPITFDIPKSAALGPRTGTVEVRSSTGQLLAELTVNLEVTEPIAGVVPPSLAQPASSRIGRDNEGLLVVLDGLTVGIDGTAPDPNKRILEIAAAHDAIVMGSTPDLRMYDLMLDVSDLAELEVARLAIASEANVAFASMQFLGSTGPAVPNDPGWGGLIAVIAGAAVTLAGAALLRTRRREPAPAGRRWVLFAATTLIVAGAAMALGSFLTWGSCSVTPCGGGGPIVFPMGTHESGVKFGSGIATALFGTVLVLLGMEAARIGRRPPMVLAVIASMGALVAIAPHLVATYASDDQSVSGPYPALYLTTIAALVALVASLRLVQFQRTSRRASDVKRP